MANRAIITDADVKDASRKILAERLTDELEQEFEEDESELQDEEEIAQELQERDNFDVFDDVINARIKHGDMVKWTVHKNGELVATRTTMGSWEQIHQEFGAGHFKIRPRSGVSNKWLRSQTMTLGQYRGQEQSRQEIEEKIDRSGGGDFSSIMKEQAKALSDLQKQAFEREKYAEERAEKQLQNTLSLVERFGAKKEDGGSKDVLLMMLEQQREENRIMREEMRRQDEQRRDELRRLDEQRREEARRQEEKFEKMLERLSANKQNDGISWNEHWKEIRQIERQAKEDARRERDEIERLAAIKAEELADRDSDKSLTDRALEGVLATLPQLSNVFLKNSVKPSEAVRSLPTPRPNLTPRVVETAKPVTQVQSVEKVQNSSKIKANSVDKVQKAREKVLELTLPIIGEHLLGDGNSIDAAEKCIDLLSSEKVPPILMVKLFTLEDYFTIAKSQKIWEMAEEHGKLEQLKDWLGSFYETVKRKTSQGTTQPQPSA